MSEQEQNMLNDLTEDFCRRAQLYGCDAIQVLMSSHEEKGQITANRSFGRGNWYARQGLAQEFLTEEFTRVGEHIKAAEYGDDSDE